MLDSDKIEIIKMIMDILEKDDDFNSYSMAREIFYKVFLPILQREKDEVALLGKIKKKSKSSSH